MTRRTWVCASLVVALSALSALAAGAQTDEPGSSDHPAIPRMPNYYISEYDAKDFGSADYYVQGGEKTVEGRTWVIGYWIKENQKAAGPLQISRNYANAVTQKGGVKLFEEMSNSGGRMTARLPTGGGKYTWIGLSVSNHGEVYDLTIVEEAAVEQVVQLTASELARTLKEQGAAAVYGILFDTGKATIKPESQQTLSTIAEVLGADRALRLEIQGHTDNVGAKAANRKLSADRAAAVKAYLVQKHGIAPDRLTTTGFADDRPVADNASDAGRAKNRRVELVRK